MPRPFRVNRFDLLVVAMVGAFLWSLFASLGGDLGGYEPLPSDAEGAGTPPLGWKDLWLLDLESGRVDPRLASLHFSPRGEAKWVRGPSGRGASRLARAGVLEQYVEHGNQAQRSHGGHTACFDRRVVRNAG